MIGNDYIIKLILINYKYIITLDKSYRSVKVNNSLLTSYNNGKDNMPISLEHNSNLLFNNLMNIVLYNYSSYSKNSYMVRNKKANNCINTESINIYKYYKLGKESKFLIKLNRILKLIKF